MDANCELKLYDHVEFLAQKTNSRPQLPEFSESKPKKKAKKRKPSQAARARIALNKSTNVEFKLTPNELLFIPKHHDPTPLRHPTTSLPNDLVRQRKYMEKIKNYGPNEQRQLRTKEDIRYLPPNANELSLLKTNADRKLCLDHLNSRCKATACDKYHQLRNPRLFGVCKYYVIGSCRAGDSCPYMHEEFPCRYYYLGMPHPNSTEKGECGFKHGGPLPPQLGRYFKKQLEEWVKKLCTKEPLQFHSMLTEYTDKFDDKHAQLEQEYGVNVKDSCSVPMSTSSEQFSLEHILSVDQIRALAKRNVTNAVQVNQIPVDELVDCGLTMDQIYKITINTCEGAENNQTPIEQDDIAASSHSLSNSPLIFNDSPSSIETDISFEGFCDTELTDAVEELQSKKVIADEEKSSLLNVNECSQEKIDDTVNNKADSSDDSNDSDDDFNLTIDEDVE